MRFYPNSILTSVSILVLGGFLTVSSGQFINSAQAAGKKKPPVKTDPRILAAAYMKQADAARQSGDLDKAAKSYQQAFTARYNAYGYRDPETVKISRKLADVYIEKKDFKNAEHYLDWAMKALVKENGHGDYSLAPVFEDYARLYKAQDKLSKALEKQNLAAKMYARKDESSPTVFSARVKLADILVRDGQYKNAQSVLDSAKNLKEDYEYEPDKQSLENFDQVTKLIAEKPFPEKVAIPDKKVAVADVQQKKAKPAAFASTGFNLNAVRIDNLDKRTVVDGPLEEERAMLLEFIAKSNRYGIGVKPYVAAFDQIETLVEKGADSSTIEDKVNSLSQSLKKQFYVKAIMSNPRYHKKKRGPYTAKRGPTSTRRFGINPYWEKYDVPDEVPNDIEDKYANTPITEGYLKQIESEVVRKEMARMPGDMKYTAEGNAWFKRLSRQAKRKRINNWRNREMRMDYR